MRDDGVASTGRSIDPYGRLVEAIASGAVLFVGAGSSCRAGYPDWLGLLARLREEAAAVDPAGVQGLDGIDGLLQASNCRRILGAPRMAGLLRSLFAPREPAHTADHETLVRLPFLHVLTTNYDGVLQSAHRAARGDAPLSLDAADDAAVAEFRRGARGRPPQRTYIHLHGSVERCDDIVLANEDYQRRYHNEPAYTDFLRDMLTGYSVVFVGFGVGDQDFMHVLRSAEARARSSAESHHFALLARPLKDECARAQAANLRGKYGVEAVYFDNSAGDFGELWRLVSRLERDVKAASPPPLVEPSSIEAMLDRQLAGHPDLRRTVLADFNDIVSRARRSGSTIPSNVGAGGANDIDREIDGVFALVTAGRPDEAIARYEAIASREVGRLTPKHRYRLAANIGNACYAKGMFEAASGSYLQAVQHYRESRDARAIEVLGHFLAGDLGTSGRLAESLCADEPDFGRAWSLWARSQRENTEFGAVRDRVPESVRGDAEVSAALADLALRAGHLDDAVLHARTAVAASPDWPDALATLGAALLTRERSRARFDADRGLVGGDADALQEADRVITHAIDGLGERDPAGRLAGLLFNRSVVRRLSGDLEAATTDLRSAFARDPSEPVIALGFAMHAEAPSEVDSALAALRMLRPSERDDQAQFAEALLLSRRGGAQDGDAALALVEALSARLDGVSPRHLRGDVTRLRLQVLHESGRAGEGPAAVDGLPPGALGETQGAVLRARAALLAGLREDAERLTAAALAAMGEQDGWFERRELAALAGDCGLHEQAASVWRSVVGEALAGSDGLRLAVAAFHAGDRRTVLRVCEAARAAGFTTRTHVELEVQVLASVREPARALKVLKGWVTAHPSDKHARLSLAALALHAAQPDLAALDPGQLPSVEEVRDAREGAMLVFVLRRGRDPLSALGAASALFRRFPDEHTAHLALVASVFDPSVEPLAVDRPSLVAPCTAVCVGRGDESARWVFVEDGPSPSVTRGEYPKDHPFVRSMWGKRPGESFEYEGHMYRIHHVEHRDLRRVHEVMERYEENFPEHGMLRRFTAPSVPRPDATLREKLGPEMFALLEADDKHLQQLEAMYKEQRLPIASFARFQGRAVFDVVRHLAGDSTLGVRADTGEPSSWDVGASAADAAELVLDATALAGALILGLLDDLPKLERRLLVPRAVLDEVRTLAAQAVGSRAPRGRMGMHQGRFFFVEYSPHELAMEVDRLESVVRFVQDHCEVVGGEATIELDDTLRKRLAGLINEGSLDAVALAKARGCPVWTDDVGLVQVVASAGLDVGRTWTQAVARNALDRNRWPRDRVDRLHGDLLVHGYSFTRLSAADIAGVFGSTGWRPGSATADALARVLAHCALMNPGNALIVGMGLREILRTSPRSATGKQFVLRVLDHAGPERAAVLARFIYRFGRVHRRIRVPSETIADRAGAERAARRTIVPVAFDPFGSPAGRALKRFLRAWRSRDGECRPERPPRHAP